MRQFSLPLTISSSSSRRTTSQDPSVSKLDSDLAPPQFPSNPPSSRSSRSNSFLASLTRSNPSPLVISTNLPKADDSLPSSPESAASPSNPNSLSQRFSWSKPDKLSVSWDEDDEILNYPSHSSSSESSPIEHLLVPGDVVCHGGYLQSEPIQIVPIPHSSQEDVDQQLGEEFEVVRRLGAGSYAVVYLVREVLSRPQSDDDHPSLMGDMDMDASFDSARSAEPVYGREYAIKCLSKANLEEGGLAEQLAEVRFAKYFRSTPHS